MQGLDIMVKWTNLFLRIICLNYGLTASASSIFGELVTPPRYFDIIGSLTQWVYSEITSYLSIFFYILYYANTLRWWNFFAIPKRMLDELSINSKFFLFRNGNKMVRNLFTSFSCSIQCLFIFIHFQWKLNSYLLKAKMFESHFISY